MTEYQAGPLASYVPCTQNVGRILEGPASLNPRTLAIMHGSSFTGNCRGKFFSSGNKLSILPNFRTLWRGACQKSVAGSA